MRAPARARPSRSPARRKSRSKQAIERSSAKPAADCQWRSTGAARPRRRERKNITSGVAHVNAIVQQHDDHDHRRAGQRDRLVVVRQQGFKGSRKSTPYAAQVAAEDAGRKAMEHGMRTLEIEVSGPGSGRESALRALQAVGFADHLDPRRDADPAQRLPPAQAPPRLKLPSLGAILAPAAFRTWSRLLSDVARSNRSRNEVAAVHSEELAGTDQAEEARRSKPAPTPAATATIVAEPLERGFGLTLGNALRRVLLSSLQGAAVTVDPDRRRAARVLLDPGRARGRHRHRAEHQADRAAHAWRGPEAALRCAPPARARSPPARSRPAGDIEIMNPEHW